MNTEQLLAMEPRTMCEYLVFDAHYGHSIRQAIDKDELTDEFCERIATRAKNEIRQLSKQRY